MNANSVSVKFHSYALLNYATANFVALSYCEKIKTTAYGHMMKACEFK